MKEISITIRIEDDGKTTVDGKAFGVLEVNLIDAALAVSGCMKGTTGVDDKLKTVLNRIDKLIKYQKKHKDGFAVVVSEEIRKYVEEELK